jgi:hypothetical protein
MEPSEYDWPPLCAVSDCPKPCGLPAKPTQ